LVFFAKEIIMSKTTITRGNIIDGTMVQASLPSTTISGTSTEVTFSVPGVSSTDMIIATFDGSLVTGISIGNAYTTTDGQVKVRLINSTGSSATQTAGTMLFYVMSCEDQPIPTSVI
jgi:hypothetical protein